MTGSAGERRGIAGEHMRRVIGRILIVAATALPLSAVLWGQPAEGSVGSGLGTAVMKCRHFKDAMIISPGLSHTPTDQTVAARGRVYGCNKAGGGGKYTATLTMKGATCESRTYLGEAHFSWANGQTSIAALGLLPAPVEPLKVEVVGRVNDDHSAEHLGPTPDDADVGLRRHPGQHDAAVGRRAAGDDPGGGRRGRRYLAGLRIRFARKPGPHGRGLGWRAARPRVAAGRWRDLGARRSRAAARSHVEAGPEAAAGRAPVAVRDQARLTGGQRLRCHQRGRVRRLTMLSA